MFETSVIHAEVGAEKRVGLLSVSFAGHALIVISILALGIRNTDFPTRAPAEYTLPVVALPVPIPPPALGTPNGGHRQTTPPVPVKQKTIVPSANLAPNTLPAHTEPLTPSTTTGDTTTTRDGPGSDQPLGVPWGVKGGVGVDGPPAIATVEPDAPIRITGDVISPVVIHRVTPLYPRAALAARLNGSVIVECIIDRNGRVREAHVLRSTSTFFEQSAIDAVQQWQFTPGSLHGKVIDTIFDLTVTFKVSS
ncbi:MAG TPA: TonB family protein [Thermoanaerobaculia bacterium]|jgi:protein TonB|nr:TonB family protein [Thermoanaerobaculia bacterium]